MSRRDDILDAALETFDRKGVLAATVDDIPQRITSASVGSIYHHFGDKEGIAEALYAHLLGAYQHGFSQALDGKGAEAGVRAVVHHTLRWAERNPAGMRYLLSASPSGEAVADLNRRFFHEVMTWVESHPEIREIDVATGHAIWLGPANEYCRHWLAGRAPKPGARLRDLLAETAWRSLCLTPMNK